MEGSNHCLSYDADEINENNQNNHQVGFNLKKQNKTTKNFMSPTISAASKAVVPRKKILSERNESSELIFSDTNAQKTPNFYLKPSSTNLGTDIKDSMSPIMASFSGVSQFDDEEQKTFVSNSSLQPYDPSTNYLTPRPKFLRYKPYRHRETFLHYENESKETEDGSNADKSGSFDSKNCSVEEESLSASGSPASSSEECFVRQEDEEIGESDEEIEDAEEERDCILKGVLNTLLVFVILVLSTLYISSMNSPTPPPALFGTSSLSCFEDGNEEFLDQGGETEVGLVELIQRDSDDWVEVQNMAAVDEWVEAKDKGVVENSDELGQMLEPNGGDNEVVEMVGAENEGTVSEKEEGLELQGGEIEDVCDYHQDTVSAPVIASEKKENADGDFKDEAEESQVLVEEISKEEVAENELVKLVDTSKKEGEVIHLGEESNLKVNNLDTEVNSMDEVVEQIETGSMAQFAIGVCIYIAVVSSLVLGFHFKSKRSLNKGTSPGDQPCSEPVIAEKTSLAVANEGQEHIEKVYSFATPSSLIHSMEEVSKEFYQSRAPTLELLGEFEVGELSAASLRSCRTKSRMVESDLSHYSISQEESSWSKGQSTPIQPLSEFSYMDSPSYGSFTASNSPSFLT